MRYKKYTGVVLKKQNYKEADQILTLWTQESGKVRVFARSLKSSKSKLVYNLQDLSLVEIEVAGSRMPTLISAKTLKSYKNIGTDLTKIGLALYAVELLIKITPDEQPNEQAFDLITDYLSYLNDSTIIPSTFYPELEVFCLKLLSGQGFGTVSATAVSEDIKFKIAQLVDLEFQACNEVVLDQNQEDKIHRAVRSMIEFVLERKLKSEPFLISL